MPRQISKRLAKAHERFKAALTDFIKSKGARPDSFYDFKIYTLAGVLHVSINEGWIACRFDDLEAGKKASAATGYACNPHSGKWNFHFFDGSTESLDPAAAIATFGTCLDSLLQSQVFV